MTGEERHGQNQCINRFLRCIYMYIYSSFNDLSSLQCNFFLVCAPFSLTPFNAQRWDSRMNTESKKQIYVHLRLHVHLFLDLKM
jgi:hypothetical protein